jgi:hypothetical protein
MTELKKPAWLRDAERYVRETERENKTEGERMRYLVKTIDKLTQENLDLKGRLDMALGHDASADDAENAALELKETRELMKNE